MSEAVWRQEMNAYRHLQANVTMETVTMVFTPCDATHIQETMVAIKSAILLRVSSVFYRIHLYTQPYNIDTVYNLVGILC